MARVSVNRDILLWALERSEITEETIEARFPKFAEWLEGAVQPTLKQLENFARATHAPFGYFFLPSPPEERLPIPHYRTVAEQVPRRPSPELLDTVHTMQVRQGYMREFLEEQGNEPLPFVGSANLGRDPKVVAQQIRATLGLTREWAAARANWQEALRTLESAVERAGILVMANGVVGNNNHRPLKVEEFRGFALVDEFAPLVFINAKDGKAAQMFTLAHEVAHIWFGHSAAFDLRGLEPAENEIEQACNKVAAELLVSEEELRELWPMVRGAAEPHQEVARHFKVSVLVAARRAKDLGLITREEFFSFYDSYLSDERRRREEAEDEGGNFYATQARRIGRRFAEAVIRATREGKLSYHEAFSLTGLRGKTFDQFASRLLGEFAG
jgi:Zn-dependent peptidase ImmA (M78 family)